MKIIIKDTGEKVTSRESERLFEYYYELETGEKLRYKDLARGKNGKPFVRGGKKFNLSHSGSYWCMAIGENEVGVDIEVRRKIRPAMARRILAPDEEALDGDLLRTWVLKEAYVKMTGEGLGLDFRKIRVKKIMEQYIVEDHSTGEYVCFIVERQ